MAERFPEQVEQLIEQKVERSDPEPGNGLTGLAFPK